MFEFFNWQPHSNFEILLILMVVVWGAGRIFKALKLPPMIGEVLAGVLIGPSVLGLLEVKESVTLLAELGVFFLMFHAGLDTDIRELLGRFRTSISMALGGLLPVLGGVFWLISSLGYSPLTAAFVAVMMAFPSVPVMSSVLKNYKLKNTNIGHTALGAAIIAELTLFALLSVVIMMAQTDTFTAVNVFLVISKVCFFFGAVLLLGRILLPIISPYILNRSGSKGFTFALIVALVFGLLAEMIGLHVILGAYLGGMFVREEITDDKLMKKIEDRFYALSHSFLGPIFFAWVGMNTDLSALEEYLPVIISIVIIILAAQVIGGMVGSLWIDRLSIKEKYLATLALTSRGSTEIVVAQVGFSMLVISTGEKLLPESLFVSVIAATFLIMLIVPLLLRLELFFLPGYNLKKETQTNFDL